VKAEVGQPERYAMDAEDLRSYRDAMRRGSLRAFVGSATRLSSMTR
jgi:hypothetical protein